MPVFLSHLTSSLSQVLLSPPGRDTENFLCLTSSHSLVTATNRDYFNGINCPFSIFFLINRVSSQHNRPDSILINEILSFFCCEPNNDSPSHSKARTLAMPLALPSLAPCYLSCYFSFVVFALWPSCCSYLYLAPGTSCLGPLHCNSLYLKSPSLRPQRGPCHALLQTINQT